MSFSGASATPDRKELSNIEYLYCILYCGEKEKASLVLQRTLQNSENTSTTRRHSECEEVTEAHLCKTGSLVKVR